MEKRVFQSSAWARGVWWFPHILTLEDHQVTYRKNKLFGSTEISVPYTHISSVKLENGILFSRIIIETDGGERIDAPGFWKSDARKIKKWIDEKKKNY